MDTLKGIPTSGSWLILAVVPLLPADVYVTRPDADHVPTPPASERRILRRHRAICTGTVEEVGKKTVRAQQVQQQRRDSTSTKPVQSICGRVYLPRKKSSRGESRRMRFSSLARRLRLFRQEMRRCFFGCLFFIYLFLTGVLFFLGEGALYRSTCRCGCWSGIRVRSSVFRANSAKRDKVCTKFEIENAQLGLVSGFG